MKLYGYPQSRSTRVQWLLAELDLEYEFVNVDLVKGEQFSESFRSVNPYGKVPVLVDDDTVITESAAICTWLAEKYSGGGLIPAEGSVNRAHYYQWVNFCMAELEPFLWSIRKHMLIYPKPKRSRAAIELAKGEYSSNAECLARYMNGKDYILNRDFSAADVVIGYNLLWADTLRLLGEFPVLREYVERLKNRPAFPRDIFD